MAGFQCLLRVQLLPAEQRQLPAVNFKSAYLRAYYPAEFLAAGVATNGDITRPLPICLKTDREVCPSFPIGLIPSEKRLPLGKIPSNWRCDDRYFI